MTTMGKPVLTILVLTVLVLTVASVASVASVRMHILYGTAIAYNPTELNDCLVFTGLIYRKTPLDTHPMDPVLCGIHIVPSPYTK